MYRVAIKAQIKTEYINGNPVAANGFQEVLQLADIVKSGLQVNRLDDDW